EGATLGDTSRRVARALTLLELTEGVNEAAQLPVSETAMLIEPWLGEDLPLADLPLPRLIDVRLAPGADIDLPTLRRRLREAVPGAKLDDHGAWMTDLVHLASAVEAIARVLMLVIGAAGALAVAAATKAKLAANASAVDLLHLIGATDRFIARQFERQVLTTAALAGVIGLLLALATLVLIGHTGREIETMLLPDFSFTKGHKAALAAIPLIAGTIAIMTARLTVLANLKRKP
ncbi:MAG: FtsX-like permease family protein, partial [Pseudomonadota bacterium]|nr:FtsX-like permease family protein [Pseudomonadota bacterium]